MRMISPPAALQQEELCPNYLVLADGLTGNVHRSPDRRARLEGVARAGKEYGCEIVATSLEQAEDAEACREMGCRLGQGVLFGRDEAVPLAAPCPAP